MNNLSEIEYERINPFFISFLSLRKAVGWLGILLAPILVFGTKFIGNCPAIQYSISHYYYTIMGDVFVGIICAISFFLIAYPGYDKVDNRLTNIAGVLALGIAFLPTNQNTNKLCTVVNIIPNEVRESAHLIIAGLFFLILSYIAIFRFTKSKIPKKSRAMKKVIRNRIYRICGVMMFLSIVLLIIISFNDRIAETYEKLHPVFWLEFIALFFFGFCWLVKGELFLKDNELNNPFNPKL